MLRRLAPQGGWGAVALLLALLLSVGWTIEATEWTEGLAILKWSALLGVFFGFIFTRAWLPHGLVHRLSIPIGLVVAFLLNLHLIGHGLRQGAIILTYRLHQWLRIAAEGGTSTDNLTFLFLMTTLLWFVGYLSSWYLFRYHSPWPAITLSGITVVIIRYYGPSTLDSYLCLYLLIAMMLLIQVNLSQREQEWREARVGYGAESTVNLLRDGLIFSVLAIAIAWLLPTRMPVFFSPKGWPPPQYNEWQIRLSNLFTALKGYRPGGQYVAFGNNFELGGPLNLTSEVVMLVQAPQRRYWRAMVYDEYSGRGWINTDYESEEVAPKALFPKEGKEYLRQEITQTITLYQPTGGQLFAAGEPLWVDQSVTVRLRTYATWRISSPENKAVSWGRKAGVSTLTSRKPLASGQSYTLVSLISEADEEDLRATTRLYSWSVFQRKGNKIVQVDIVQDPSTLYPDWVIDRYLQLPPDLPERIKDKALELTRDYDNIYDRLVALENYLRQYPYDTTISPPPEGRDAVDYFLFDLQRGYCNYFASTMVVMARSIGIPARLAVGFAGGEYDRGLGSYKVRRSDTHAWVEAYFPGYGWIEFEPTPSQPPIARTTGATVELEEWRLRDKEEMGEELDRSLEKTPTQLPRTPVRRGLSTVELLERLIIVLLAMGGVLWGLMWRRRQEDLPTIKRIYRWMALYSRLLAIPAHVAQTPTEYATLWAEKIPQEREGIFRLAELYLKERFSPKGLDSLERMEANAIWQDMRLASRRRLLQRDVLFYWIRRCTSRKRTPKDSS